jgi:hypothetical protein
MARFSPSKIDINPNAPNPKATNNPMNIKKEVTMLSTMVPCYTKFIEL